MNDFYSLSSDIRQDQLVQIGKRSWLLVFGFFEQDGQSYNWRKDYNHEPTLDELKADITALIEDYDSSTAVNSFLLNGATVWLDKSTRVGLVNSTTICKQAGLAAGTPETEITTTLWLDGVKLVIPCDTALQLLSALELYALECFNVTAQHKADIAAATSVDELMNYDYTGGYPDKLTMSV